MDFLIMLGWVVSGFICFGHSGWMAWVWIVAMSIYVGG